MPRLRSFWRWLRFGRRSLPSFRLSPAVERKYQMLESLWEAIEGCESRVNEINHGLRKAGLSVPIGLRECQKARRDLVAYNRGNDVEAHRDRKAVAG